MGYARRLHDAAVTIAREQRVRDAYGSREQLGTDRRSDEQAERWIEHAERVEDFDLTGGMPEPVSGHVKNDSQEGSVESGEMSIVAGSPARSAAPFGFRGAHPEPEPSEYERDRNPPSNPLRVFVIGLSERPSQISFLKRDCNEQIDTANEGERHSRSIHRRRQPDEEQPAQIDGMADEAVRPCRVEGGRGPLPPLRRAPARCPRASSTSSLRALARMKIDGGELAEQHDRRGPPPSTSHQSPGPAARVRRRR